MAFEYPSNFSNGTIVDGLGSFFQYASYTTGGLMGAAILLVIFVMSFVIGLAAGSKKALLSSSFITFVFSVYFWRIEMINPSIMFVLILVMVISAIGSKSESGRM